MLSHSNKNGMVFSADKFHFTKEEVKFAGIIISMDGIKPSVKYLSSRQTASSRLDSKVKRYIYTRTRYWAGFSY